MPSKSKTKGKTFEREVCVFLSSLYEDSFTRVPDSGAFTGGKNAYRRETLTEGQVRAHKGDIIPPDEWKYFNAECKSYAEFPFHQLLTQNIPLLEGWLEQTRAASDEGDLDILFFKITRKGTYLAYRVEGSFFHTTRHIDYRDNNNILWRITGFNEFFNLNKQSFKIRCLGG